MQRKLHKKKNLSLAAGNLEVNQRINQNTVIQKQ